MTGIKAQKKNTVMFDLRDYFRIIRENFVFGVVTNRLIKGKRIDFIISVMLDHQIYKIIVPDHYSGEAYLSYGNDAVKANLSLLFPLNPSSETLKSAKYDVITDKFKSHYERILLNQPNIRTESIFTS